MAEETNNQDNQAQTPTEEEKPKLPENIVTVEDSGTLKKKITITVPRARIDAKLNEMFGELSQSAAVPGFRVGHAPRRLIEKRFGREIGQDVRNALVGESIGQAAETSKLRTLGEPEMELDKIELPETGDMTFSLVVEVAPELTLPELKGIKVNRPVIKIDEKRIDDAIESIRHNQIRYEATEDPAAEGDAVLAGAKISAEGVEAVERHGLTLRVAPGQVEGLPMLELGKVLADKKAGDVVTVTAKATDSHPNEAWRGKDMTVELTISQVRHSVLPEVNEEYAKAAGFESLAQFRQMLATRLEMHVKDEVRQSLRNQVCKYLLENTKFDLPEGVVSRHAARIVMRKSVDLMYQGVPQETIQEHMAELQAAASTQAMEDLRLSFILGKFAEDEKIDVTQEEINARVAETAQQYNRRPERMKQEMESDGSLSAMADRLLEDKALDKLLEAAEVTEVDDSAAAAADKAPAQDADSAAPAPKKIRSKKSVEKAGDEKASDEKADDKE